MKVLIAARLSVLHDGETGLDTQEREVVRWAEQRDHEVIGIAADHKTGKSHLWDRPRLRPWVTQPDLLAKYDAIVALKVDRLTRADDEGVSAMKDWARRENKSLLISSAEVRFPSEGMEGAMWDMYIRMAHAEWLAIKERYGRMQAAKHDVGSLVGPPCWGYEIVSLDGIKTIVPTAEGQQWVPQIMAWVIEERTLRWIGEQLRAEGLPGPWHESTIAKIVKRPTYSGQRDRKGRMALAVEPVVSRAFQEEAIAALNARARLGRSGTVQPKALLAGLRCGHPDCPGEGTWPMYRVTPKRRVYYRCYGRSPNRKGCGNMVPLAVLDALVLHGHEVWDQEEHVEHQFVPGNDASAELERLRSEMADAMRTAPADKIAAVAADYAERIAELEAQGSVAPHWREVPTGMSNGDYLATLDLDGQRAYLAKRDIRAWKDGPQILCTVDGLLARTGGRTAFADVDW